MSTATFLTFVGDQCGKAEEAAKFYTSLFPNSEIKRLTRYAEGAPGGASDLVKFEAFTLDGVDYFISENNYSHAWSMSPAVSILIKDESAELIQTLYEQLSSGGGQVMIPLDDYRGKGDYGFGEKFGWCEDRYGVSWQFVLLA